MSPWLSQRRVTFDDPVETISAILDRLYRAEQIIERLNAAPETLGNMSTGAARPLERKKSRKIAAESGDFAELRFGGFAAVSLEQLGH